VPFNGGNSHPSNLSKKKTYQVTAGKGPAEKGGVSAAINRIEAFEASKTKIDKKGKRILAFPLKKHTIKMRPHIPYERIEKELKGDSTGIWGVCHYAGSPELGKGKKRKFL